MVAEPPGSASSQVTASATKPLLVQDLPSLATSETVLGRFRQDIGASISTDILRSKIRAKVASDSNMMPIQYTDIAPDSAIRGANALADEVETFYRELATKRFDSLIADLEQQTSEHAKRLATLDGDLQNAAQQYPYVDVASTTDQSVYKRLISLRSERDEAISTTAGDRAAAVGAQQLISNARAPAMRDIVENDAEYRNLRDQYARDVAQLQRLESYGSASYPGLQELRDIVSHERNDLESARNRAAAAGPSANLSYAAARDAVTKANAQLQSDSSRVATLNSQIHDLNQQISKGGIAARVAGIRRDRDNEEAAYSALASRLSTTIANRAEAASTGSLTIVDRANTASRTVWTTSTYVATAIAFLTLWSAVSLALLLEGKQEQLEENAEDVIRGVYDAPLIGSV
jgi:capsular polysaccharide biosynthesis protein